MWLQMASALPLRFCLLASALAFAMCGASAFMASAQDDRTKSAQIFERMATVFEHPRCMNCHANANFPTQGDDHHRHTMNVMRGPDDRGAAGLHCSTCHQSINQAASGVPGAPDWHLAPLRMAWAGLTAGQICQALLDPARGGMKPDQLIAHLNTGLVLWAWSPGKDERGAPRTPPPLTHDAFIALTQLWLATGAACPAS
jgi:hypothetical protein